MNISKPLKSFKIQLFLLPICLFLIYALDTFLIFLVWILQALYFLNPKVLEQFRPINKGDDDED